MKKINYRFFIEYDGSRYLGWQRLGGKQREKSIQGKLELILAKLYEQDVEEIQLIASGRTDAGVHAKAQVANIHLEEGKTAQEIEDYCNHYLPEDIRVFGMQEVEERFHSRFLAKEKEYQYRIAWKKPSVFEKNYIWRVETKPDIEKMRQAAKLLLGEHDFAGFSSLKKTKKSTRREIFDIRIEEEETGLSFSFSGNGFLQNMVRILVGTLLEIGEGKREMASIERIFESKDRRKAGFQAPAKGLILIHVNY